MKKINLLLFLMFLTLGTFAQKTSMVMSTPNLGVQYNLSAMSPNGKWACGVIYDGVERGFLWNLSTGEMTELSLQGTTSAARSVSDNGIVTGAFETTENTPNNRPVSVYGTWEKGVWKRLAVENEEAGTAITLDGMATTISRNGEYVGGIARVGKVYKPILWDNGKMIIIDDIEGAVYAISEDGNTICGWTTHPVKKNRTSVIWTRGENNEFTKKCIDLDSPYAAGPFSVATGISPNKKYVIACNSVYNTETGDTIRHELDYFASGFELFGVTNDGSAYGFTDDGDYAGGELKRAMKISLDRNITYIREYLVEQGVDLDIYPYVQSVLAISEDENTYALNVYDENYQPGWLIVKLNANRRMAPVELTSRTLPAVNGFTLTWKAPLFTDLIPEGYNIYRNGVKINSTPVKSFTYIDSNLEQGTYNYTVTAVYERGRESEKSQEVTVDVNAETVNAPVMFNAYRSAFNDVRLLWEKPYSNLPSLSYFKNNDMISGLGAGDLGFECGIAVRADELKLYKEKGYKITEISFIPMSRQNSWTVNFYEKGRYKTPLYTEQIPSENLKYGKVNYFTLTTPFEIPEGIDVVMAISVDATDFGGYDIIGMNTRKADVGYSDLIRQEGEEEFYSLYEASMNSEYGAMEYNVRWAMGILLAKGGEAENIKQYIVSADGVQLATVTEPMYRVANVANGAHKYEVTAEYANGAKSAAAVKELTMYPNRKVCSTVTPEVTPGQGNATLSWETPSAKDESIITYSNDETSGGVLPRESNNYSYTIASIYKGNELAPFEGFEFTGFRFYPLCDADFTFHLIKDNEEIATIALERNKDYIIEDWSVVKLEQPIEINRNSVYKLTLDCDYCTPEETPVGMDTQPGYPNMSDLYSTDGGYTYKSIILDGGKDANWMIGIDVASKENIPLSVEGYNIYLDNEKKNNDTVTENSYILGDLKPATYSVRVNPVYGNGVGEKQSADVTFVIDVNGIDELTDDAFEIVRGESQIMINGADVNAIEMFDMNGAKVAESNSNIVNIASVNNGIYVMKIMMDGKCMSTKISIRR